jgi:hypothetical protein
MCIPFSNNLPQIYANFAKLKTKTAKTGVRAQFLSNFSLPGPAKSCVAAPEHFLEIVL